MMFVSEDTARLMNITDLGLGALATVLNLFLLYLLFRIGNRSLSLALIGVVGGVDLLSGMSIVAMSWLRLQLDVGVYLSRWFCNGLGMGSIFLMCMSSYFVGLLAVERYLQVCRFDGIPKRMAVQMTLMIALTLLGISIGTSVKAGYNPDPTYVYCLPHGTNWSRVLFTLVKAILVIPFPILIFSYIKIFVYCCETIQDFPILRKALRAFLFIAIYTICFIPTLVLIVCHAILDLKDCPNLILVAAPIGLAALPVANPFLVLLLHQQMRATVSQLFANLFFVPIVDPKDKLEDHPRSY